MNKSSISLPPISTLLSPNSIDNKFNYGHDFILPKIQIDHHQHHQEIISSPSISSPPLSSPTSTFSSTSSTCSDIPFSFVSPIETFSTQQIYQKNHIISQSLPSSIHIIDSNKNNPIHKKRRGRPPIYYSSSSSFSLNNNNNNNNNDNSNTIFKNQQYQQDQSQDWTFLTPMVHSPLSQLNQEQKKKLIKNQQQTISGNTTHCSMSTFSTTNLDHNLPWKKRGRKPKLNYNGHHCFLYIMVFLITKNKFNLLFSSSIRYYSATTTTTSTSYPIRSTIPLSFTKYSYRNNNNNNNNKQSPSLSPSSPVIICHGLFGSKQNWKLLAKAMSQQLKRDIYALDLRNHGESDHALPHTYQVMANNVKQWLEDNKIEKPILLGHSMGGKTVMTFAMLYPNQLSKLIVEDIAPIHTTLFKDNSDYIQAMKHILRSKVTTQKEADHILQQYEPDLSIRQFLLTNLTKNIETGIYQFRVPVDLLGESLKDLGAFIQHHHYMGPTLFITGGKSPYRKPFLTQSDLIQQQFPHSTITCIDQASHWVHAEKPDLFLNLVTDFITSTEAREKDENEEEERESELEN
ncbi:unnamed protein product [Cunninghamella echinulata]